MNRQELLEWWANALANKFEDFCNDVGNSHDSVQRMFIADARDAIKEPFPSFSDLEIRKILQFALSHNVRIADKRGLDETLYRAEADGFTTSSTWFSNPAAAVLDLMGEIHD